ncbi:hypothetical protein Oweho_3432 [Owenweeksia hongkongensis DSM 17368]|uniref:Uncharacterized protein n=1 Tax=Owenweeksia hongkongensis (strain DSM 17368 / CIP 108786 / JCM 12287 / NRRL B-23963 / UST20020801) TaxID=926562 RepID=G8R5R5_OWEHD|nr:hypothetical protein [Owenweeksia hongkongensis]AEV34381.1 hypothetical protein Oweho_3432 [Owenweeksia hongkongensis DSM 17368]
MEDLLLKIKQPWGLMRLLRLGLAIIIIMEAWHSQTWWLIIPAMYFAYQSLANAGCSTCPTPPAQVNKESSIQDIEYEEVK